jgi:hypothetical protein
VRPATVQAHVKGWKDWQMFVGRKDARLGIYLDGCSEDEKRSILLQFAHQISERQGRSRDAVTTAFSAMNFNFRLSGRCVKIFDDPCLQMARKAARNLAASGREMSLARERMEKLPVTTDMVVVLRDKLLRSSDIDDVMTYVATAMAFNFMWRSSEFIFDKDIPHAIRCSDVVFLFDGGVKVPAQSLLGCRKERVEGVFITVRSSKMDQSGLGRKNFLGKGKCLETQLLGDFFDWCLRAGRGEGDCVFSRVKMGRQKYLTNGMVQKELQWAAEKLGGQASRYSVHSLRSGGRTALSARNVDVATVMRIGGWTEGSDVHRRYDRATTNDRGAMAVEGLSLHEVVSSCSLPAVASGGRQGASRQPMSSNRHAQTGL